MSSLQKLLDAVLRGTSDREIPFNDLRRLLMAMGFDERIKGSHHIFSREGVVEIIDLQPLPDGKAKPYQVKQVRQIVARYGLEIQT